MTLKIALIGGESSGKTTLANALSQSLEIPVVPEYGRILGQFIGNIYTEDDMRHICSVQCRMEDKAVLHAKENSIDFVVCDTTPLVTMFYSNAWYNYVDMLIVGQTENRNYDFVFLCKRDFPFVNDGTRGPEEFSLLQEKFYEGYLEAHKIPYNVLTGPVRSRVEQVVKVLGI
jgi:nicotinamide riboside kinase